MENHQSMFEETKCFLEKYGFLTDDRSNATEQMREFEAGGHYGIEISSMNNYKILVKALELAEKYNVKISRVIECRGIVRLPDNEIKSMVKLCSEKSIGLVMSIGPRALSDIGGFAASLNGKRVGYRLRGMSNVIYAIEDVKRAVSFGVKGFTIYDEGLMYYLNKMREDGLFPKELMFKFSVHACCSNPLSGRLMENIGADTINIIPDLDIEMIASFRPKVKVPIDVFSDTAKAAGGFLRTYDMPKVVKIASPVYLKCGPISQPDQNHLPNVDELEERIKQARNVQEHIKRYLPKAKLVNRNEKTLAIPGPQFENSRFIGAMTN